MLCRTSAEPFDLVVEFDDWEKILNLVIPINDREAIPVRAIPLLTYWEVLSPDDLAAALTFLASEDGAWVNGQVWHVNGGAQMRD